MKLNPDGSSSRSLDDRATDALVRIKSGHASMRIPPDDSDPDFVIVDMRKRIDELEVELTRRAQSEQELRDELAKTRRLLKEATFADSLLNAIEERNEARAERDLHKAALERSLASEFKLVGDCDALAAAVRAANGFVFHPSDCALTEAALAGRSGVNCSCDLLPFEAALAFLTHQPMAAAATEGRKRQGSSGGASNARLADNDCESNSASDLTMAAAKPYDKQPTSGPKAPASATSLPAAKEDVALVTGAQPSGTFYLCGACGEIHNSTEPACPTQILKVRR